MSAATGAVTATYTVHYTTTLATGTASPERVASVSLIENYSTWADIPRILAVRHFGSNRPEDVERITITLAVRQDAYLVETRYFASGTQHVLLPADSPNADTQGEAAHVSTLDRDSQGLVQAAVDRAEADRNRAHTTGRH